MLADQTASLRQQGSLRPRGQMRSIAPQQSPAQGNQRPQMGGNLRDMMMRRPSPYQTRIVGSPQGLDPNVPQLPMDNGGPMRPPMPAPMPNPMQPQMPQMRSPNFFQRPQGGSLQPLGMQRSPIASGMASRAQLIPPTGGVDPAMSSVAPPMGPDTFNRPSGRPFGFQRQQPVY